MFRNNYQGGAVVEIFSGQGKDPVAKWKLCGGPSAIRKEYNKEVKGFVYCLEGSSQTVKMQMPENGKMSLGLLQRFLVLQVNIPQFNDFSTELVITDSEHQKKRLYLSTVHKELSATLLHAKIPLVGLKRNTWSTLCIDLVSLTGELFKGFLSLDGITLFATCKVRRIFTMKTEPTGISDDDMSLSGAGLMDLIPRSCQYPADVSQVTQVLNMENLRKADMRTGLFSPGCVSDHSATARSISYRRTRPQGVLHTASGSRAPAPYPQTERKSNATSDATDDHINNMGSMSSIIKQKVTEGQNITYLSENISHGEPSHVVHEALGASGSLQPHPPQKRVFDKQGSKKLRVRSAGRERIASSAPPGGVSGVLRNSSKSGEKRTPPLCGQESRQQPLTLTEKSEHLAAGEPHISYENCCSLAKESSGVTPTPAETGLGSIRPGLSSDLQVRSSWESNEESEPQLTLQEEVFTFSSQPHSPKRGQGQGDQEKMEMGDDRIQSKRGRRYDAQPEDDFIGSESDEDKGYTMFQHQNTSRSTHATSRTPDSTLGVQLEGPTASPNMNQASPEEFSPPNTSLQNLSIGRTEPTGMVPARCLSPDRQEHKFGLRGSEEVNRLLNQKSSVSLCRRFLQEVKLGDSQQHKEEDDETPNPVDSSHYDLHLLGRLRMQGDDDEELRMLASLKREQEEDEFRASGLSASQIHQCNVSISMSSDDTSTWTHVSMPANQGHHYQKEMTTLQQSNPRENSSELRRDSKSSGNKSTVLSTREWMDVLSPPIMPPSQQRRSGNTWSNLKNLVRGGDEQEDEGENEDEYLNLLYDPCLNCYFDPKTGKYYELA